MALTWRAAVSPGADKVSAASARRAAGAGNTEASKG
jgi:hypothetical protein